jgi:hypothetical protein
MHQLSLLTHQRQAQCQHPVHAQDVVGNNIPKMTEANNIPKMTEVDTINKIAKPKKVNDFF